VKTAEAQNGELMFKLKDFENQKSQNIQHLQRILEPYQENGNYNSVQSLRINDFDELLQMVQEKLKKLEGMVQVDMNARILEKFDQLRDYYRV